MFGNGIPLSVKEKTIQHNYTSIIQYTEMLTELCFKLTHIKQYQQQQQGVHVQCTCMVKTSHLTGNILIKKAQSH